MSTMLAILKFNPLSEIYSLFMCSSKSKHHSTQYFAIQMALLCTPAFIVALSTSVFIVFLFRSRSKKTQSKRLSKKILDLEKLTGLSQETIYAPKVVKSEAMKMWTFFSKFFVWFCIGNFALIFCYIIVLRLFFFCSLVAYPTLSMIFMKIFLCRNLGTAGTFLWADYSTECYIQDYYVFYSLSIFGVVLIPIGLYSQHYYSH